MTCTECYGCAPYVGLFAAVGDAGEELRGTVARRTTQVIEWFVLLRRGLAKVAEANLPPVVKEDLETISLTAGKEKWRTFSNLRSR